MATIDNETALIKSIKTHLISLTKDNDFNMENIVGILISTMQFVQNFKSVNGSQKKKIVIKVIKEFINDKIDNSQLKKDLNMFADLTMPILIDKFIALNNGEITIKTPKCCKDIFKKICCF